jgi:hypothetical protein
MFWWGEKAERNLGNKPGVDTSQTSIESIHASLNADGKLPSMELLSPLEYEIFQRRKVCGVDVHKQFFVAALLSQTGESTIKKFQSDSSGLLEFKEWVLKERCERGRIGIHWGSTGILLIPQMPLG